MVLCSASGLIVAYKHAFKASQRVMVQQSFWCCSRHFWLRFTDIRCKKILSSVYRWRVGRSLIRTELLVTSPILFLFEAPLAEICNSQSLFPRYRRHSLTR